MSIFKKMEIFFSWKLIKKKPALFPAWEKLPTEYTPLSALAVEM